MLGISITEKLRVDIVRKILGLLYLNLVGTKMKSVISVCMLSVDNFVYPARNVILQDGGLIQSII